MNSTIILISLLMIFSITVAGIALFKDFKKIKEQNINKKKKIPLPAKSIKLFSSSGTLLLEHRDCYVTHFSTTLYLLSHEYKSEAFLQIDKGSDMLLLIENYTQGETDAKNEVN